MKKLTKYFIILLAFIIVAQPLSAITHYQSSNLSAKDTIDISADKVTIEASKNSNNRDYQKDHAKVAIDISLTGGGTTYSADLDTTTNNSSGDTYNNSHIDASNIKISSIKDTNIKGATLKAKESAKLNVGGNLNIESLQDTKESSTINLSAGVSAGGENGAGGKLGFSQEKERYKSVGTQTSISSDGTLEINTKGNTNLVGAKLEGKDSTDITTGTLTYRDIKNETDYSSVGGGVSVSSAGTTPNITAPMLGDKQNTTKTAISSNRVIKITNKDKQTQDTDKISSDTKNSHHKLKEVNKELLNIRKDMAGEVAKTTFNYVAHEIYDKNPELEKYLPKTIVHGIVGGVVSQIAGGSFKAGATGAAVSHEVSKYIINKKLARIANGEEISQEEIKADSILAAAISTAIIGAASGGSATDIAMSANIGKSNVENNNFKVLTTMVEIARKVSKIKGKITKKKLKEIGFDEIADIIDDGSTILDPKSTMVDRIAALADLVIGTELNNKKMRLAKKASKKKGKESTKRVGKKSSSKDDDLVASNDKSVTGPKGGKGKDTGKTDKDGNPIIKRDSGGHYVNNKNTGKCWVY
jgi:hypothetical protein